MRYLNIVATGILLYIIISVLFIGKALFLPLIIALVFWYIIINLSAAYQKIPLGHWRLPYPIALVLALASTAIILYLFFALLAHSISNIISAAPIYQQKLQQLLVYLNKIFSGKLDINRMITQVNLSHFFSRLALIISTTASHFILILIYVLFLLLEYNTFDIKLKSMCHSLTQYSKIKNVINKIIHDINNYLKIKTMINLIAGVLSFIVLWLFGISYAEFWGLLFFIAHYIPYIGPIAAVILVLIAASITIPLATLIILGGLLVVIQFGIGNVLEPRWMGTRLNLSPIVILISLTFWGMLWGVLGMLLCIPIMVVVNIVLSKFEKTRPIAVALSADGKVEAAT